jgi:hypothetical protein
MLSLFAANWRVTLFLYIYIGIPGYSFQTCMSGQRLTFPDEAFSMAIPDAEVFSVKEINCLKILHFTMLSIAAHVLVRQRKCSGITPRHCNRLLQRRLE